MSCRLTIVCELIYEDACSRVLSSSPMVAIVLYIKSYIHTKQFVKQLVTFYDDVIKQVNHSGCFYLGASLDNNLLPL